MFPSLRIRATCLALIVCGGLAGAEPHDLASLEAVERELAAAYREAPGEDGRWAWIEALSRVGWAETEAGDHRRAAERYREAVAALPDDAERAEPEFVAMLHDGLGRALHHSGDLDGAEIHLATGLRIRAGQADGEERLAISEGHLGLLQLVRGRYAEAGRLFHSALRRTPDDRHDLLAHRHDCLGRYHLALRAHDLAAMHYDQAILHALVEGGADDPLVMDLRANLVLCRFRAGDAGEALIEAEGLLAGNAGKDARRAALLNLCATIHASLDAMPRAGELLAEALEIITAENGAKHPAIAPIFANLGAVRLQGGDARGALEPLENARAILLEHVSEHHQTLVEVLYQIAACRLEIGEDARQAVVDARAAASRLMAELVAEGSERELLTFQRQIDLHSIVCRFGDEEMIADSLLDGKGRIMEAVLDRRTHSLSSSRKIGKLQAELDRLVFQGDSGRRADELRAEIRRLAENGRTTTPAEIRWKDIARALPRGSVYLDAVRYVPSGTDARYGAVMIAGEGEPVWIPLGEERLMGRLDLLHRSLETRANLLRHGEGRAGIPMVPLLADLHRFFWQPIAEALPEGTKKVIVSPEGKMHLLPFAVLRRPDGRFLCEEIPTFRVIESGRRLAGKQAPDATFDRPWVALGVADFAPHRKAIGDGTDKWSPAWAEALAGLDDLPSVRREIAALRAAAPAGSVFLLEKPAAESALHDMITPPAVLHIASHGLNVPLAGGVDLAADPSAFYENGILLGWDGADDGILFPEEAAALDLRGTGLVTLSTCRGALGRPVSGEGLLGLRRGFAKAGARNVLASLWEIPDTTTADFMANYYTTLKTGGHPADVLWTMQAARFRQLLAADPQGGGIETAILSYGGFGVVGW